MNWLSAARFSSLVLAAALFVLIFTYADAAKMKQAFLGIRWSWTIWVPVLNLLNTFVEAFRLSIVLFPLKKKLLFRSALNSTLIGIIGNVLLPLRFGDGARAYYVARAEKLSLSSAFSATMLDRIADLLLFFALIALTALFHPFPPSLVKTVLTAAGIFAAVLLGASAAAGFGRHIGRNSPGRLRNRIAGELNNFLAGLQSMRKAGLMFPILLISALSWLLRAAMVWFMFKAFALDLPLMATPITLILLNLGIAMVSTPANLGGFELASVGALKLFSVDTPVALSYAVALHVIEVVPMTAFGMIYLWFEGYKTADVLRSAKAAQRSRPADGPVSEKDDMAGKH